MVVDLGVEYVAWTVGPRIKAKMGTTIYEEAKARQDDEDITQMSQEREQATKEKPRLGKLASECNSYDREGERRRR